jgi:hypothetical protein
MDTENEFPCQWGSCSSKFSLESDLFIHLKAHTKLSRKLPCNWRECTSSTVYSNVGYLNDHVLSHLSASFLYVWCETCRAGFRNRQSLSRHQKKSGCNGSFRDGNGFEPVVSGSHFFNVVEPELATETIMKVPPSFIELEKIPTNHIESIFDEMNLSPELLSSSSDLSPAILISYVSRKTLQEFPESILSPMSLISPVIEKTLEEILVQEEKGMPNHFHHRSTRSNRIESLESKQFR